MFWGARNVGGRGFDKEENRPTNLQIGRKVIAVSSIVSRLGDDTLLKTCKVHPETEDDAGQNIVLNSLFAIHSFPASIQPVSNTIH